MPLILHGLTPIHWAVAGAGIALITLALLFIANRRLGISTGLEDVCSFVLPVPYFARDAVRSARKWRLPFIIGLVIGGHLSAFLGGGFTYRDRSTSGTVRVLNRTPNGLLLSMLVVVGTGGAAPRSFVNTRLFAKENGGWRCRMWMNVPEPAGTAGWA